MNSLLQFKMQWIFPVKSDTLNHEKEVVHAYADHSKAKRIFGIDGFTSLEDGIRKMSGWARKTGIKASVRFKDIEVIENLPAFWTE